MHFGTETNGLNSKGGLNFGWSLLRNFTVYIINLMYLLKKKDCIYIKLSTQVFILISWNLSWKLKQKHIH